MSSVHRSLVIIAAIAICSCLTLCTLPQVIAKKQDGHCHEQNPDKENDLAKSCCSGKAILTATPEFSFPAAHCEYHPYDARHVAEGSGLTGIRQALIFVPPAYPSSAVVLRI